MEISSLDILTLDKIVIQPTTLCNLNCSYCYLPGRDQKKMLNAEVVDRLRLDVERLSQPITLIWHGGEPLTAPVSWFEDLVSRFEPARTKRLLRHTLQTNATLITETWCRLFHKYCFHVGVSIDGPRDMNRRRVNWADQSTFDSAVKGINCLKDAGLSFGVIAVVGSDGLGHARELYEFMIKLGANSLAINIEEIEGVNSHGSEDSQRVNLFWASLFQAWRDNPRIRVREFRHVLSFLRLAAQVPLITPRPQIDLFPTILWNGDVVLLSPELAGGKSSEHLDFVVGNILNRSLADILSSARTASYVTEYFDGVRQCHKTCEYYQFCRGGHASNKFFEHGRLDVTETAACRNTRMRLLDAVLAEI